jgi:pyruvate dehydrogenase E1 component alpha subunit
MASRWDAAAKRSIDLLLALVGLAISAPVLAAVALMIKREDGGPVLYRSVRVGRDGAPFRMLKFRTMVTDAERLGGPSAADDDPRITRIGRVLRGRKLDELPQLVNVVRGEMSLVGPRPEVPQYAGLLAGEERAVLSVRPGLTDWASLWNRDEGALLAGSPDPERAYLEQIRPVKIRLQLEYVRRRSLRTDLAILAQTIAAVLFAGRRSGRGSRSRAPHDTALPSPVGWPRPGMGTAPGATGGSSRTTAEYRVQGEARAEAPAGEGPVDCPRHRSLRTDPGACPGSRSDQAVSESAGLREMYTTMVRIRKFEERVADLIEAGEIRCPCHLCIGQEAIAAGVCAALERDDYVWGGHRSHGHYLAKGGDPGAMMAELFGKATGCSGGRGGSMHLFAPEVGILGTVPIVAATIPLAAGAALASTLGRDRRVSVAFFGDGATEEGHYHESMNLAALYRLPVVFVCENNLYASHMTLQDRRPADSIAEQAEAHGVPAVRLDGNDVGAVHAAARAAVDRARAGDGPGLLECLTYRWRGHVGPAWDMDVGIRRADELADWLPRDPIRRARLELLDLGVATSALEAIEATACAEVARAVAFAREAAYPPPGSLLDAVYAPRARHA